jgi:hypothetical protein
MANLNVSLGAAIAGAPIDVSTAAGVIVTLGGTFSGTVTFEAAGPNGAFNAIWARPVGGAQAVTTATAAGVWIVDTAGFQLFRVRVSTYSSGLFLAQMTTTNYITKGGVQNVSLASTIAGEDITNDVLKAEQRFSYLAMTGDTQVKAGAGFLHTITFAPNDLAPTAGSIILYDSLTEANTQIFNFSGIATTWFVPFTLILDVSFSTGLYVGFTTTADVNVTVSYR